MVDFIMRRSGPDYDCNILIEGDIPQAARITLQDCDLHVVREELEYMEAEQGMSTTFRIYDLSLDEEPGRFDKRLKKAGGESLGSISILWFSGGNEMKINHLKIDNSVRGEGLGSVLMMIAFGLGELAQIRDIGFWIGGGGETVDWLVKKGVPRSLIDTTSTGNVSTTMRFREIDYDRDRITVRRD